MTNGVLQPKFIKLFSRGQITLPKDYRDYLDIDEKSWLKISLGSKSEIVIQPVKEVKRQKSIKPKLNLEKYKKILSRIKGSFSPELEEENKQIRKEMQQRLKKLQF